MASTDTDQCKVFTRCEICLPKEQQLSLHARRGINVLKAVWHVATIVAMTTQQWRFPGLIEWAGPLYPLLVRLKEEGKYFFPVSHHTVCLRDIIKIYDKRKFSTAGRK